MVVTKTNYKRRIMFSKKAFDINIISIFRGRVTKKERCIPKNEKKIYLILMKYPVSS
jgi:hypothetical protein